MSSKQCSSNTSVKLQRRGSGTKDYSARENVEGGESLPKLQRRGGKDYSARENGISILFNFKHPTDMQSLTCFRQFSLLPSLPLSNTS